MSQSLPTDELELKRFVKFVKFIVQVSRADPALMTLLKSGDLKKAAEIALPNYKDKAEVDLATFPHEAVVFYLIPKTPTILIQKDDDALQKLRIFLPVVDHLPLLGLGNFPDGSTPPNNPSDDCKKDP